MDELYDDSQQQFFADTEEEAHFYSVMTEFLDLMDDYSPQFVMMVMFSMIKDRDKTSLNSIN
jgi:hypothetical protein